MSTQFRRSRKVGPFRFTFTHRGVSVSARLWPLSISRSADGTWRRTWSAFGFRNTEIIGRD